MTHDQIILKCLAESGRLTLDALAYESDLTMQDVEQSMARLASIGKARFYRGSYQLFDELQSKRIKNGLLVASIPSICG